MTTRLGHHILVLQLKFKLPTDGNAPATTFCSIAVCPCSLDPTHFPVYILRGLEKTVTPSSDSSRPCVNVSRNGAPAGVTASFHEPPGKSDYWKHIINQLKLIDLLRPDFPVFLREDRLLLSISTSSDDTLKFDGCNGKKVFELLGICEATETRPSRLPRSLLFRLPLRRLFLFFALPAYVEKFKMALSCPSWLGFLPFE